MGLRAEAFRCFRGFNPGRWVGGNLAASSRRRLSPTVLSRHHSTTNPPTTARLQSTTPTTPISWSVSCWTKVFCRLWLQACSHHLTSSFLLVGTVSTTFLKITSLTRKLSDGNSKLYLVLHEFWFTGIFLCLGKILMVRIVADINWVRSEL